METTFLPKLSAYSKSIKITTKVLTSIKANMIIVMPVSHQVFNFFSVSSIEDALPI